MVDLKTYLESDSADCEQRVASMRDYMKLKIGEADWHAVADAAMDIRDIEARLEAHSQILFLINSNQLSSLKP